MLKHIPPCHSRWFIGFLITLFSKFSSFKLVNLWGTVFFCGWFFFCLPIHPNNKETFCTTTAHQTLRPHTTSFLHHSHESTPRSSGLWQCPEHQHSSQPVPGAVETSGAVGALTPAPGSLEQSRPPPAPPGHSPPSAHTSSIGADSPSTTAAPPALHSAAWVRVKAAP